jgi:hypothetical protein
MGSLQLILLQKDHPCQQDAIVNDLTHKEIFRLNAIGTVGKLV